MLRTALSFALRGVAPIAVSLALGASVVTPTFADQAVAQAAVQTRALSCAGFNFHPIDSRTAFRWSGRVLFRSNNQGDGWFLCSAQLPHKAVVKQVRFTVKDAFDKIDVRYCALVRVPLSPTGQQIQVLAVMSSTGVAAKPGIVRLSDTSIDFATVDNANYTYYLQCQIYFDPTVAAIGGAYAGIIGADVTYTISAADG